MQLQNSNDSANPSRAQMYLLGFLIGYCIIKRLKYHGIPENFPPGPPCIPLLGSAPFIQVQFRYICTFSVLIFIFYRYIYQSNYLLYYNIVGILQGFTWKMERRLWRRCGVETWKWIDRGVIRLWCYKQVRYAQSEAKVSLLIFAAAVM